MSKPMKGVMEMQEYDDMKSYKIACDCGDNDHMHDLTMTLDQDDYVIETMISFNASSERYGKKYPVMVDDGKIVSFFKNVYNWWQHRITMTYTLWTKGYVEVYADIILNEEFAKNYADVLNTAVKDLSNVRNERKKK